jgi:hypothetical protein
MGRLLPFYLLILFLPILLTVHITSSLTISPASFIEFYAIYHFYNPNETIYGLIIQNITSVYPNGTVKYLFYNVNLNDSAYVVSPASDNLLSPESLYIFYNVGNNTIYHGEMVYVLVTKVDGYYIYRASVNIEGVKIISWLYINKSEIPYKLIYLQYSVNGILVSNTTFILYSSNLINPDAKIYIPSGLQLVQNSFKASLNTGKFYFINDFFMTTLLLSLLALSLYKVYSKYGYKKG